MFPAGKRIEARNKRAMRGYKEGWQEHGRVFIQRTGDPDRDPDVYIQKADDSKQTRKRRK